MGLLQKYNVNTNDIESIEVNYEAPENNGYLYRIASINIHGIKGDISTCISSELANEGNTSTIDELKDFIVEELGITSSDLIEFETDV